MYGVDIDYKLFVPEQRDGLLVSLQDFVREMKKHFGTYALAKQWFEKTWQEPKFGWWITAQTYGQLEEHKLYYDENDDIKSDRVIIEDQIKGIELNFVIACKNRSNIKYDFDEEKNKSVLSIRPNTESIFNINGNKEDNHNYKFLIYDLMMYQSDLDWWSGKSDKEPFQQVYKETRIGRPPKYDWEALLIHFIGIANKPDGIFVKQQVEVEEMIMNYFVDNMGDHPAESVVRSRAAKIWQVIKPAGH